MPFVTCTYPIFECDKQISPCPNLVKILHKLEYLNLKNCNSLSNSEYFEPYGNYTWENLKFLNIMNAKTTNCVDILSKIFSYSRNLEQLFIYGGLTSDTCKLMVSKCPNITHLGLRDSNIKGNDMELIAQHYPNLLLFTLRKISISDDELNIIITGCPKLTALDMFECSNISDTVANTLSCYSKDLKYLDLIAKNITDNGIAIILDGCSKLKFYDSGNTMLQTIQLMKSKGVSKEYRIYKQSHALFYRGETPDWDNLH